MPNSELVKIGALWVNRDKNGKRYLSGKMGDAKLLVFENNFKEGKQPDYKVYVAPYQKADAEAAEEVQQQSQADSLWDDGPQVAPGGQIEGPTPDDPEIPF